eukprot:jgi/Botrbrau1/545/Bobra.0010s0020.1
MSILRGMKRPKNKTKLLVSVLSTFAVVSIGYIFFGGSSTPRTPDLEDPVVEASVEDNMSDSKHLVEKAISDNPVFIFSKSYCPYCKKAKAALSELLPPGKIAALELDLRPDGDNIQDALAQLTGGRSVPRVFIGGKFIGGGDDTVRLKQSGELAKLLQNAGVLVS